jgi:exonuclease SbcC
MANHRFQGFTGHRLQLELNDRNEFVVRDLMNNGETRHIKTLSGGQTFLASLSMAIALADIIQGHKPGSGNFFFIDEGFGSLDKPSLQTVFQALQSLSREKRIVGIISHVEELQDEIQTFLRVSLDMEEGSRIVPSWL